MKLITATRNDT